MVSSTLKSIVAAALLAGLTQDASPPQVVYDRPFDAALRLQVVVSHAQQRPGYCCTTHVRVIFVDRADQLRSWELPPIDDNFEFTYRVERTTSDSVVFFKVDNSYGVQQGCVKLFVDPVARRLIKTVDYSPAKELEFTSDEDARRVLGVSAMGLATLRERGVIAGGAATPEQPDLDELRERVRQHRPPTSTYRELARARPKMVAPPYDDPGFWMIEEEIGTVQAEGDGIWFGKTFYNGEGATGVGDIGYLDANNRLRMLHLREAADWSIDSMLVEKDTIWAGLTARPEGADYSGGLLEYSRRTRRATVHTIPDVIGTIVRADDGLFVRTSYGVYVLRQGRLTRFRAEPSIDDGVIVVRDRL
jgi:hypothetical protein